MQLQIDVIQAPGLPRIYHRGPNLNKGPLPSVFYFSLSGEESLGLDPYNQPAIYLSSKGVRVFSITLPAHDGVFPHKHAIQKWAHDLASGKNIMEEFVDICIQILDFLIHKNYLEPSHIGVAGLSRGAYIATQLAAKDERIRTILGFAPLTRLDTMKDFEEVAHAHLISTLSLESLIPKLINKTVRYYIGNYDTLVGTPYCFSFIHSLSKNSYNQKHRFPPVELIIYPSIGHKGHGTPPEIFHSGSSWLAKMMSNQTE